jgi:Rod binding domain-containing protein
MNANLSLTAFLPSGPPDRATRKEVAAARDFEALLIAQMLRSVREEGSGWLGTGDDEAGATASSLGEDQLAKAMAQGGGLGLSKVIASGLAAQQKAQTDIS